MSVETTAPIVTAASSPARAVEVARTVIEPSKSLFNLDLKAVWEYRELLYFLVWRDVKVRY